MGFSLYVNSSSEHNLVPWITEYMHRTKTHELLYCTTLHHVASWGKERYVAGGIRGHSTPDSLVLVAPKRQCFSVQFLLRYLKTSYTYIWN